MSAVEGPAECADLKAPPEHSSETETRREHILAAAIDLFARQGFHATGVREIAREAGVSLSMISYHFGGKSGVLGAAFERFFKGVGQAMGAAFGDESIPFEAAFRGYVRRIVQLYRQTPNLVRVAVAELAMEPEELAEIKHRCLSEHMPMIWSRVDRYLAGRPGRGAPPMMLMGPAAAMFIASHFLLKPMLVRDLPHLPEQIEFDEAFYEGYPDWIADLLLYGMAGPGRVSPQG